VVSEAKGSPIAFNIHATQREQLSRAHEQLLNAISSLEIGVQPGAKRGERSLSASKGKIRKFLTGEIFHFPLLLCLEGLLPILRLWDLALSNLWLLVPLILLLLLLLVLVVAVLLVVRPLLVVVVTGTIPPAPIHRATFSKASQVYGRRRVFNATDSRVRGARWSHSLCSPARDPLVGMRAAFQVRYL
jgi:hypothetical protein